MLETLFSKLRQCKSPKQMHQLHGVLITTGFHNDNILFSKFIQTCTKIGISQYGHLVFKHKYKPNVYLYNTMIKSLSLHPSSAPDAVFLFNNIRVSGLFHDSYSFPFALKAASRLFDVNLGRQMHGQTIRSGFDEGIYNVIAIVQVYATCGYVRDARKVFDEMSRAYDVPLWNAMIAGYIGVGDMDNVMELFESMKERNVITWTSVIVGYVHGKRPEEAIEIFRRMRVEGVEMDEVTMLAALSACADLGSLELGEWIHESIEKFGLRKSVALNNALVDMYVKSGNIEKAIEVFEGMVSKSVVSWTTMIVGLAFHGLGKEALEMFSRMERAGVRPNDVTFIGILSACSHVGLVELGRSYFESMSLKYGITPKIQHYGCMIDLLGRAGCLQEAEDLVTRMPFKANAAIWGSLLAASRTIGDASLAAKSLRCLSELEPSNSGNYALLSNTYAALGQWNEARLVRKNMRSTGVKKMLGGSSIEIKSCVFRFSAGTVSYPKAEAIHEVLWEINQQCAVKSCELNNQEQSLME